MNMTYKRQAILLLTIIPVLCNAFTSIPSFTSNTVIQQTTTTLESHQKNNHNNEFNNNLKILTGGVAAFVLSLGTFANVAFASSSLDIDIASRQQQVMDAPSIVVSAGAPKFSAGGSFETMDFSLPSYSEAVGGDASSSSETSQEEPKKSLFGELKLPELNVEPEKAEAEEKAKEKAADAAEQKRVAAEEKRVAAEKAAEEKRLAAEEKQKAAEEKRLAAEKAAEEKRIAAEEKQKAAEEKKARLEAEKKKQEEAAARMRKAAEEEKAAKKEAEEKAKQEASFEIPPPAPKVSAPTEIKAPEFKAPDFKAPEFKAPDFKAPEVNIPSFSAPKINLPSAPKLDKPAVPLSTKVNNPPSFDAEEVDLEPQEVRDERARNAKSEFKKLDQEAKDIESQARKARNEANIAKKEAQIAKNEACKTRFGGKVLCIRPFGSGY